MKASTKSFCQWCNILNLVRKSFSKEGVGFLPTPSLLNKTFIL